MACPFVRGPDAFAERDDGFSWDVRFGGSYGEGSPEAKTTGSLTILESIDGMMQPRTEFRTLLLASALLSAVEGQLTSSYVEHVTGIGRR